MTSKDTRRERRRRHLPRNTKPKNHDTYARRRKSPNAVVCTRCAVVFHAGRWTWGEPPETTVESGLCPACERMRDRYPAGTLRLPREFLVHRDEVLGLVRNAEAAEKPEHPLERLMEIRDEPDGGLTVTTTGIHLARVIASRLERRFHRKGETRYGEAEHSVRFEW